MEGFIFWRLSGRSRGDGITKAFLLQSKRVFVAREDDDVSRVISGDDDEVEGEALMGVAIGVKVVGDDSSVLADLDLNRSKNLCCITEAKSLPPFYLAGTCLGLKTEAYCQKQLLSFPFTTLVHVGIYDYYY
ncbi:hypothetical protein V8G54_006624 [Vigna mungo]|uniref:Uncharacterized protein n=1 Tax=Vigna mungo TaxID=3915 RepID=A0AAQ3P294_VIGMU